MRIAVVKLCSATRQVRFYLPDMCVEVKAVNCWVNAVNFFRSLESSRLVRKP